MKKMTNLTKIFASIALFSGLVWSATAIHNYFKSTSKSDKDISQIENPNQINYQMARPDEGYSEYSLSGRPIDETVEKIDNEKHGTASANAAKNAQQLKGNKNAKSKTKAATNEQLARKNAEAMAQMRSQQLARQRQLEFQKRQSELSNLAADAGKRKQAEEKQKSQLSQEGNGSSISDTGGDVENQTAPQASTTDSSSSEKKSYAQWKEFIFATATRQSIEQFLAAHRKKEVTAEEVQLMAKELTSQANLTLQGLGLYTLRLVPSSASLVQLVNFESKVNSSYANYLQQALASYLQPQYLSYVSQTLQIKDKAVVSRVLSLLGDNLQKIAQGDHSALVDGRGGRSAASSDSGVTLSSYASLIPALQAIGSSQDQDNASIVIAAQQIISYIQSGLGSAAA